MDNKEQILDSINKNVFSFILIPDDDELKKDKDIVLKAVEQYALILKYAHIDSKNDFDIVSKAVTQNGLALEYASDSLKNDFDIVSKAVNQNPVVIKHILNNELILTMIKNNGLILEFISYDLQNKEIVLEAINNNGIAINYVSPTLIKNSLITKAIDNLIDKNIHDFYKLSKHYRKDKEIVKRIVPLMPHLFLYVNNKLRNDKEFIFDIIQNNSIIFNYIPDELKKDREFVLSLIKQNEFIYSLIPKSDDYKHLNSENFQIKALEINIEIFKYLSRDFNNKLLLKIIDNNPKDLGINFEVKLYDSKTQEIILSLMTVINFNKSILFYKPIYYHFLDGYINKNEGSNLQLFITKFHDKLTFNNNNIKIKSSLIESSIIENDFNNNPNIYYIFQTMHNNHTTSLLLFIKDNKHYILSFNSGLGINNHQKNNDKYIPYYGIIIDDYCEFINIYNFIKDINKFYDDYKNHKINNVYINNIGKVESPNLKIYNDLSNIQNMYYDITEFINNIINIINIKSLYFYKDIIKIDNKYIIGKHIIDDYFNKNKYYDNLIIFFNILIDHKNYKKFIINNLCDNIFLKKFADQNIFNSFNINVKNKIILHLYENELYINEQQSGSCSWFSLYWPLVFYNIFINNNYELYVNYIDHIYRWFESLIKNVFTKDNFKIEYDSEDSNFNFMKILCKKFIDIKILDIKILNDEIDFIYNNNLKFTAFDKDETYNNIEDILKDYDYGTMNYFKDDINDKKNIFKSITELLSRLKEHHENNFVILLIIFNMYILNIDLIVNDIIVIENETDQTIIHLITIFNNTFNDNDTSYITDDYIRHVYNINEYYNYKLKGSEFKSFNNYQSIKSYNYIKENLLDLIKYIHRFNIIYNLLNLLYKLNKLNNYLNKIINKNYYNDGDDGIEVPFIDIFKINLLETKIILYNKN